MKTKFQLFNSYGCDYIVAVMGESEIMEEGIILHFRLISKNE